MGRKAYRKCNTHGSIGEAQIGNYRHLATKVKKVTGPFFAVKGFKSKLI